MAGVAISPTVRTILEANIEMPADEVIVRAKAKGVKAPDSSIRDVVYKIKSELRKKPAKPAVAATAARTTTPTKTAATPVKATAGAVKPVAPATKVAAAKPVVSASPDLSSVFSNVALVNKVVGVAGGVDQARQVAQAVKACGSVEAFLKHLELVAGIKSV